MKGLNLVTDDYVSDRLASEKIIEAITFSLPDSKSFIKELKEVLDGERSTFSESNKLTELLNNTPENLKDALRVQLEIDTNTIADNIESPPDTKLFSSVLTEKLDILKGVTNPDKLFKTTKDLINISGYKISSSRRTNDGFEIVFKAINDSEYRLIYNNKEKDYDIQSFSDKVIMPTYNEPLLDSESSKNILDDIQSPPSSNLFADKVIGTIKEIAEKPAEWKVVTVDSNDIDPETQKVINVLIEERNKYPEESKKYKELTSKINELGNEVKSMSNIAPDSKLANIPQKKITTQTVLDDIKAPPSTEIIDEDKRESVVAHDPVEHLTASFKKVLSGILTAAGVSTHKFALAVKDANGDLLQISGYQFDDENELKVAYEECKKDANVLDKEAFKKKYGTSEISDVVPIKIDRDELGKIHETKVLTFSDTKENIMDPKEIAKKVDPSSKIKDSDKSFAKEHVRYSYEMMNMGDDKYKVVVKNSDGTVVEESQVYDGPGYAADFIKKHSEKAKGEVFSDSLKYAVFDADNKLVSDWYKSESEAEKKWKELSTGSNKKYFVYREDAKNVKNFAEEKSSKLDTAAKIEKLKRDGEIDPKIADQLTASLISSYNGIRSFCDDQVVVGEIEEPIDESFADEDKYCLAVILDNNMYRVSKLFDTREEAEKYVDQLSLPERHDFENGKPAKRKIKIVKYKKSLDKKDVNIREFLKSFYKLKGFSYSFADPGRTEYMVLAKKDGEEYNRVERVATIDDAKKVEKELQEKGYHTVITTPLPNPEIVNFSDDKTIAAIDKAIVKEAEKAENADKVRDALYNEKTRLESDQAREDTKSELEKLTASIREASKSFSTPGYLKDCNVSNSSFDNLDNLITTAFN